LDKKLFTIQGDVPTDDPGHPPAISRPRLASKSWAMRLLEAGIAPEVIALWLGHETFNTTHQYVEANLAMKKHALEKIVPPKTKACPFRPDDKLPKFLESL
jgi:hypothetical protein